MFDLIISGGHVVDGSGRAAFAADVGINSGRIAAIGALGGDARTIVDARNRIVAPGFIDPHTHFDVQLLWDGAARPAIEHGVTTVVPGNCSLSLAPLKASDRRTLVGMFQQIEELPPAAFTEAFEWSWEGFGGYVDALKRNLAINVAPLVGHSVIRLWVMGAASQQRSASARRDRGDAGPAARMSGCRCNRPEHELRRRRRGSAPRAEPVCLSVGTRCAGQGTR